MKKLIWFIMPLMLFSCNNSPNKSLGDRIPNSFQQVTYVIDTLAGSYEIKELKNIANVILNEKGEIKSAKQTNFSFKNMDGSKEESMSIYLPLTRWSFSSDSLPILEKYFNQAHKDTLIEEGNYTFRYDNNSRLIEFTRGSCVMTFLYDNKGFWTQVTKRFVDERYGYSTYEITKREIQYDSESIESFDPIYLTINGENINSKEKSCLDYFVLLVKAGILSPDNYNLNIYDTYIEIEDEGTGAGLSTFQLCMWKTNDGKDILGTNGYFRDPGGAYPTIEGYTPRFYSFAKNSFTEISSIFPDNQISTRLFYDSNYEGKVAKAPIYFVLPKNGETITYNLGIPIDLIRQNYDENKDVCDMYKGINKISVDIIFDGKTGTFYVDNTN